MLDAEKGEVFAAANGNMLTSLLKAVGIKAIGFASSATVGKGNGSVEVALVLDNSGSMAGQAIADLRVATQNLTSVLYAGYEGTDKVRVGIVPFAGSVNVGSAHQAASWMDSAGRSPTHYENFAEQRTRFQLFTELGVKWGGCVEVRPSPHDVSDSLPAAGVPASLFVPMFAPDEPDSANAEGNAYSQQLFVGCRWRLPGAAADLPAQQPSRQVHLLVDAGAARSAGPGAHLQIRWRRHRLCEWAKCLVRQCADPAADRKQECRARRDRATARQRQHQYARRLDVGLACVVAQGTVHARATLQRPGQYQVFDLDDRW